MKRLSFFLLAVTVAWPAPAATRSVAFAVTGWTCGSCAASTRIALKKLEGVEDVKTDPKNREAVVVYDDTKVGPGRMIEAIERIGYKAKVKGNEASVSKEQSRADSGAPTEVASTAERPAERVSFFEVPLGCQAAEGLGCGWMAKPILRELEGKDAIAEARINYPGTVLAVVWKDAARSGPGQALIEQAFKERDLETAPLRGPAREKALEQLVTDRWYRADEVDRLSEREAEILASRLVGRVERRLGLAKERAAALKKDLSTAIAKQLTADSDEGCDPAEELMEVARKHLNPKESAELRRAVEQGIGAWRALPGESK